MVKKREGRNVGHGIAAPEFLATCHFCSIASNQVALCITCILYGARLTSKWKDSASKRAKVSGKRSAAFPGFRETSESSLPLYPFRGGSAIRSTRP
uniref:Uncharacterized protein n=1 Tax=Hyaloperonospora arabidopsidis (strain Emoy2) TaxID=559515 RepID=M4BG84_HYAAE